ncbi:hypothetical protein FDA33_10435 [Clostridium botulinum]|uniref:Pilus assembly protein n=1 Tax=Clostridium botulinum TaxID=1491 RepID=A0A0M1LDA4_CLOBO|nr:hypothetical protein [Clostridium botulinum]ALT05286.1 putative pilus assembly protein [Clostridium botulinum]ALT05619.1 putative pilus assembly protein [Clostridium botulinum]ALT05719.1 putative pilus assembly protein [Clostridium botulinum]ALT05821.1 putative pilus assembly protein [Clostridium botulinum]KOR55628.1 hypothetical protein ADT22_15450 [Clostridium botulinum]
MIKFKKFSGGSYADKKRRDNALKIGAIIIGTTICVVGIYQFIVLDYYGRKVRENTIAELTEDDSGFVETYILTKEMIKGKPIDETYVKKITQSSNTVPATCIKDLKELKDMSARINLGEHTVLTTEMLVNMEEQITDDVKNQDFNWIKVHAFLEKGMYVDIHYRELDGTDTIVAAKKNITNLSGNTFSSNITELERDYINNATVRAAVTGGELYTSIYPEPENQNPAQVTYVLDKRIQEQINKDPNIVDKSANILSNNAEKGTNIDTSIKHEKQNFAGGNN